MLKLAGEVLEGQLADHIVRLDAHTRHIHEQLVTGNYYCSLLSIGYAGTSAAITADKLYAIPFPVPRAMTWDRISIYVFTLDAGKSLRMGIYNDNGSLYPGTLLQDAGEVDVGTTGMKEITIDQSLSKGLYWLAFVSDGTPQFRRSYDFLNLLGSTGPQSTRAMYYRSFTYAALPDPFGAGATEGYEVWRVGMRLASLD